MYPHAALTLSDTSEALATLATSDTEGGTTCPGDTSQEETDLDDLDWTAEFDDDFAAGPPAVNEAPETIEDESGELVPSASGELHQPDEEDPGAKADQENESDDDDQKRRPTPRQRKRRNRHRRRHLAGYEPPGASYLYAAGAVLDVDDELIDKDAEQRLLMEPGTRAVSAKEVAASTGAERERWRLAAEAEVQGNFLKRHALTDTTPEERARQGRPLPMKAV